MIQTAQVAVSTTPAELTAFDANRTSDLRGRSDITLVVSAPAAADLVLGPSGVTATTGFVLKQGTTSPPLKLRPNERLYGVLATGTGTATVLRLNV